jgi:ribose transport system substrate-binding protein
MKAKNVSTPIIGEIAGIDQLELTQERSQGFREALAANGMRVANRRAAEFTVDTGQREATLLLQALPRMDALWNHDDDQGIGVLAAIQQANRSEFLMVGGAGAKSAIEAIAADNSVLKATVTYSPSMASSAISLARLIAQGRKMSDLAELQVPKEIILASETITKENASNYLPLGF